MKSVKPSQAANTLSDQSFDRLMEGGDSLLEHLSENKVTLRTCTLSLPEQPPQYTPGNIVAIRKKLNVSQSIFAQILNVSKDTVSKWELDERHPSGPSARLIQILERNPEALLKA